MPDKKLTDNEIKKALTICSTYKGKCTDCPAFVKVDRSNCKKVLLGAVEVINRQNADLIDKEKQLQDALKSIAVNKTKVIDCEKEINRLQAENEQSILNLTSLQNDLTDLQAENERLQNCIDEQDIEISRLYKRIDETKAEAYKEFAEMVKLEFYYEFDELIPSIMADRIDNLALKSFAISCR